MKCLETRRTADGFKRRRYEDNGVRFTTIEVPVTVWNAINKQGRAKDRAAQSARALARSVLRYKVLAYKWNKQSPGKAAKETGVPLRTVQRWFSGK